MATAQSAFSLPFSEEIYESQTPLLDAFDRLRQHDARQDTSFPQWIVVGDQKTGKSSVMEAISSIPFPVHEETCTRCPIQLELRRALKDQVEVTIIPSSNEETPGFERLQKFKRTSDNVRNLQDFISQAADEMGISRGLVNGTAKTRGFSESILRIHASGPKLPELSIVDLPGLYMSGTQEQDEEGKVLVERVVRKFVEKEGSIILLVVNARQDYATHSGPALLEGIKDKELQHRTMGVITHPDGAYNVDQTLKLINNKMSGLDIKWHCLRNLSYEERGSAAGEILSARRDEEERRFFSRQSKWKDIREENRGIDSLRKRLQNVQAEAVKRLAPQVKIELRKQTEEVQKTLSELGEPRTTTKEQAAYLAEMAQEFRECVEDAVRGEYKGRSYFRELKDTNLDSQIRRFRAFIREMNRVFTKTMVLRGKTHAIDTSIGIEIDMQHHSAETVGHPSGSPNHMENGQDSLHSAGAEPDSTEAPTTTQSGSEYISDDGLHEYPTGPSPAESLRAKFEKSHLPEEILKPYRSIEKPEETSIKEYKQWLAARAPQWRGEEHPLDINPALIGLVFEAESLKWKQIAKTHVNQVWDATERFVNIVLKETVPVAPVRHKLNIHLIKGRMDSLRKGLNAKLDEVLQVHHTSNTSIFDSFEDLDLTAGGMDTAADRSKPIGSFLEACLSITIWTQGWAKHVLPLLNSQKGKIGRHAETVARHIQLGQDSGLADLREIFLGCDDDDDPELQKASLTKQKCDDYYQKCLPVFVCYVNGLVVERHLLQKLGKEVFSEKVVRHAEDDVLRKIAGEDDDTVKTRNKYEEELTQLEECLKRLETSFS